MELRRRGPHFGPEPEFASVMQPRARIDGHARCVDFSTPAGRMSHIARANGLRVPRPVARDVIEGPVDPVDDTDGQNAVNVLVTPVVIARRGGLRHELSGALTAS